MKFFCWLQKLYFYDFWFFLNTVYRKIFFLSFFKSFDTVIEELITAIAFPNDAPCVEVSQVGSVT